MCVHVRRQLAEKLLWSNSAETQIAVKLICSNSFELNIKDTGASIRSLHKTPTTKQSRIQNNQYTRNNIYSNSAETPKQQYTNTQHNQFSSTASVETSQNLIWTAMPLKAVSPL
jgi:hypothetical protein